MKSLKTIACAAALALSATAANADGMYHGSAKDAVTAPPAEHYWDGLYVGAAIGYGWTDAEYAEKGPGGTDVRDFELDGFVGSLYLGYNIQRGRYVFGIEGDYSFVDGDDKVVSGNGNILHELDAEWLATLRARFGVVHENYLFYVTGGLAWANFETNFDNPSPNTPRGGDTTEVGWVLGAGVEKMMTSNWIGRLEYLYVDIDADKLGAGFGEGETEFESHIIRFGVSYKLDVRHDHLEPLK